MQAQAYRCTKQLQLAAGAALPCRNINSGINRSQLHHARNPNRVLLVSNPNLVFCRRWASVSSTTRSSLPRHLIRSYKANNSLTHFKSNARFYSSKNKYCLKRLVKGQKASRVGLQSVKDVVSGVNESIRHRVNFLQDRMLQTVFALNGNVVSHTDKPVTVLSFSNVNNNKSDNKLAEADTNIQVHSIMPMSQVTSQVVDDIKLRRWHRITGAIRRIPSPNWERLIPLVSRARNNPKTEEVDEVTSNVNQREIKTNETQTESETSATSTSGKMNITSANQDLSTDNTSGGFDCDQTITEKSSTVQTSVIESEQVSSPQNSSFNRRMNSLRERLPPLSMPSSVSDRLPSLSETTSRVKQTVGSVNLPKWTSSKKVRSPESKGDFDWDSPLLLAEAKHSYKEGHKSDASLVAEQLLMSVEKAEMKAVKAKKAKKTTFKPVVSKASIDSRTKTLAMGIKMSTSNASSLIKLERLCNHLVQYPESSRIATKERLIPCLLKLRQQASKDNDLTVHIYKTLALLGHVDPVRGRGIRVLALDGGGCRGIVAIEALREIERRTNQDIRDMFDFVVGVSSGAVLAYLLSFVNASLDQCEELFRVLGYEVFERNSIVGTRNLLFNHAYYDTNGWIKILKQHAEGETMLIDTAKDPKAPKVAAITNKMNVSSIKNYVFRNYHLPLGRKSQYQGSVKHKCWEALRASSAAPGYFEEFQLDDNIFQDGGVLTNNPSAVGLHECRLLWPDTPIQCLMSLGTGRYEPADVDFGVELTSLKTKMYKIMQSATETESVHTILQDLLPEGSYFRFNPHISEDFALDESRPDKLNQMQNEAQVYLENNQTKLDQAAKALSLQKTPVQKMQDWAKLQKILYT